MTNQLSKLAIKALRKVKKNAEELSAAAVTASAGLLGNFDIQLPEGIKLASIALMAAIVVALVRKAKKALK